MRYPIAIEICTDSTAFGVVVPDLPGCFSAGDTLDEAITNAEEAAAAWIDDYRQFWADSFDALDHHLTSLDNGKEEQQ